MYTINSFHNEEKNPVGNSHIMMFVVELNAYVHIWNIDGDVVVKQGVLGTYRQVKVTSKKKIANLIAAARKMM